MQTINQPVQSSMYVIPRVWWWTITCVYWRNKTGIMILTSSTYLPSLKNNAFILGNYTKNHQRPSKLVPSKHQGDGKSSRLKKNIRNQTSSIKTHSSIFVKDEQIFYLRRIIQSKYNSMYSSFTCKNMPMIYIHKYNFVPLNVEKYLQDIFQCSIQNSSKSVSSEIKILHMWSDFIC